MRKWFKFYLARVGDKVHSDEKGDGEIIEIHHKDFDGYPIRVEFYDDFTRWSYTKKGSYFKSTPEPKRDLKWGHRND